jgi:ethanolamine transporter
MNAITIVMAAFSVVAAIDRMTGNHLGLGKEFDRGFLLYGNLALAIVGMIVISPFLAQLLTPVSDFIANVLGLDPSILPASLFALDMGGAPLAVQVAKDARMGGFNGLVVASMMGCTISFTVPSMTEL